MHETVLSFQRHLATAVSGTVEVIHAPQADMAPGSLAIWVWRMEDDPARHLAVDSYAPEVRPPLLSCLVFASDLATLSLARAAVVRQPDVRAETGAVQVRLRSLPTDQLLALFLAARVVPVPCLSVELRRLGKPDLP